MSNSVTVSAPPAPVRTAGRVAAHRGGRTTTPRQKAPAPLAVPSVAQILSQWESTQPPVSVRTHERPPAAARPGRKAKRAEPPAGPAVAVGPVTVPLTSGGDGVGADRAASGTTPAKMASAPPHPLVDKGTHTPPAEWGSLSSEPAAVETAARTVASRWAPALAPRADATVSAPRAHRAPLSPARPSTRSAPSTVHSESPPVLAKGAGDPNVTTIPDGSGNPTARVISVVVTRPVARASPPGPTGAAAVPATANRATAEPVLVSGWRVELKVRPPALSGQAVQLRLLPPGLKLGAVRVQLVAQAGQSRVTLGVPSVTWLRGLDADKAALAAKLEPQLGSTTVQVTTAGGFGLGQGESGQDGSSRPPPAAPQGRTDSKARPNLDLSDERVDFRA